MAKFYPITITQENLSSAVRQNILEAQRVLETKLRVDKGLPLGELDANNNQIRLVGDGQDGHSACTYSQFLEIAGL